MNMKYIIYSFLLFNSLNAIEIGEEMNYKYFKGNNGNVIKVLSEEKFNIEESKNKVNLFFYIDPDKKDINEHVLEMIKKLKLDEKYPLDIFHCYVIINMEATNIPDFLINSSLESKQSTAINTTYIKDKNKCIVKKWGLEDDNYNILLTDKQNHIIFKSKDKLSLKDTIKLEDLILKNLNLAN